MDDTDGNLSLEIWRLHPGGVRVVPADVRLLGEAPPGALKWCGPFTNASRCGWWVYPPLDMDIVYRPPDPLHSYDAKFDTHPDCHALKRKPGYFQHRVVGGDEHGEVPVIREMLRDEHEFRVEARQLYAFGEVEMNVVNIWTGCIFKTPPGWCLQIRSPVNLNVDEPFRIQEGILETDWMPYDVWMNLKFFEYDRWASIRREQHHPIAHLVPVRRETFAAAWSLQDRALNCKDAAAADAARVFDEWNAYNFRKWGRKAQEKNPDTYRRERRERQPSLCKKDAGRAGGR